VLRQVRQKKTTMFKTITSAKALSVARESVEQRGERAQRGQHLRLDARVVLDELRSSCRPPRNFSCVFSRGVRRRVHGRSAASACAACAACAAVSGGQWRRRRVGSGRREARGASAAAAGSAEKFGDWCGCFKPCATSDAVLVFNQIAKAYLAVPLGGVAAAPLEGAAEAAEGDDEEEDEEAE